MLVDLLSPLTADQRRLAGREALRFGHALESTGLFGDEALAGLIDASPRMALAVRTRRPDGSPRDPWISGAADAASGAQILEAVRTGALSVTIDDVAAADPAFSLLRDRLVEAFRAETWTLATAAKLSLVISSPRLATPLVVQPREAATLSVRGAQVLYAYPAGPQAALPWTPMREDAVTPVMLRGGQAVYWPLHAPVRTVNGDETSVSLILTFDTPRSGLEALMRRVTGRPSPAATADADPTPRFDLGARGLVWRAGQAPDWAQAPKKAVRKRAPGARMPKAA